MKKQKTNLEMLVWGINHIAKNHKMDAGTESYEEDGSLFIFGENVPTLCDVRMLCADCKLDEDSVSTSSWGIEVVLPCDDEGYIDKTWADAPYEKPFHEFWRANK